MAIIYGRTVGFNSGGGVIPPRPDETDYTWYRTITSAQNLVINKPGWYRIYVVGNGGSGGKGGQGSCPSNKYNNESDVYNGAGGGGGGTGGYAIHEVHLANEDVLQITLDSTKWQVQTGTDVIYAEHGGNGGNGGSYYNYKSGAGGTSGIAGGASGGNILNYSGNAGGAGTSATSIYMNCPGGSSGAGTYNGLSLKYRQPTSFSGAGSSSSSCSNGLSAVPASGSITGASALLGGAGGGGGGSKGQLVSEEYSLVNHSGGNGGAGYTGGVVLDIVED